MSEHQGQGESSEAVDAGVETLTEEILSAWRDRLRREPDAAPRTDDRGTRERCLVSSLLRASRADDDAQALAALAAAAASYSAGHPRARLDVTCICDELGLLHDTAWRRLRGDDRKASYTAAERLIRFDRALAVAIKAAVPDTPCSS